MTDDTASPDDNLTAREIEARRARHLLDRALSLSENGNVAEAIVHCRRSLAIEPDAPQAWSMLGMLQEQKGDIEGAVKAYEKVLELAPGSMLERESLQRLRAQRGPAPKPEPQFDFDEPQSSLEAMPDIAPITPPPTIPQPRVSKPVVKVTDDVVEGSEKDPIWNHFYFRSLPVMGVSVLCVIVVMIAARVAAHSQPPVVQPTAPAKVQTPATPAPPTISSQNLSPEALNPPRPEADNSDTATTSDDQSNADSSANMPAPPSSESHDDAASKKSSAPKAKPRKETKPKPKEKPKPATPTPQTMPVLPKPKINLPQRTAPQPAQTIGGNSGQAQNNGGGNASGPVDVGNDSDSTYIPIKPPHFPNPRR